LEGYFFDKQLFVGVFFAAFYLIYLRGLDEEILLFVDEKTKHF
jgi:hypothetical protein